MEFNINRDESVCDAVIRALGSALQCAPCSMPALYDAVDTDALEVIWGTHANVHGSGDCRVASDYSGRSVTIMNGDSMVIQPGNLHTLHYRVQKP